MKETFIPSWVSCLDESMSPWTNKFTCPGFIFCPRKPHNKGNEYHSIACGESRIMFAIDLREGKDHPKEKKLEFSNFTATVSLLLRLCKGLIGTGKVVILDSGFCVLRGLVELRKRGIFASSLIKKRKYWPKNVNGDDMNKHLESKKVGDCNRLNGKMDGVDFSLLVMKEPDYNMMLMLTYSILEVPSKAIENFRILDDATVKFRYKEPFYNHFAYRDTVDNHNALWHSCGIDVTIGIEHTFKMHHWVIRIFCLIIGIIEFNVYLARKYFLNIEEDYVTFRKRLAYELMNIAQERQEEQEVTTRRQAQQVIHNLITPPAFSKWNGEKWVKCHKRLYQ